MGTGVICQKCQQTLDPETLLCPNCGALAPGAVEFESPGAAQAPAQAGRGRRFWMGLVLLIAGGLCGCAALAGLISSLGGMSPAPQQSQALYSGPAAAPQALAPQAEPADTSGGQTTAGETSADTPGNNAATFFSDDFSNINGEWPDKMNDSYSMGYFQQGNYAIAVNVPGKMAVASPPYPFNEPIEGVSVHVKARGDGGGYFGLICHYVDAKNYYLVGFTADVYMVRKVVDNQITDLTDPAWKDLLLENSNPDDYMDIAVTCSNGQIGTMVNGVVQEVVFDNDLTQGNVLIFAAATDETDANGVYEQAFFDDFSVEIQP